MYSRASRYLRRVLFTPLRQGNRGFEPHSGHLNVYLFAYGCFFSLVGTRLLTVLPRHPSKYLKPLKREHRIAWSTTGTRRTKTAGDNTRSALPAGDTGCKAEQFGAACGIFFSNAAKNGTEYV